MSNTKADEKIGVVWDLPLRFFHWLLVCAVIGAVITSKNGMMFWHEKMGLTVLGLLGFRIVWGFVGTHHARFSNFVVRPQQVMTYLKLRLSGNKDYYPGHAPTGAYATLIIIAILLTMASLGTMANDDILYEGPLAAYVGDFSGDARRYHYIVEKIVYAVIGLHLIAMIIYRLFFKIRLVPAMIHGGKDANQSCPSMSHQIGGVVLLIVMIAAAQSLGLLGDRFY